MISEGVRRSGAVELARRGPGGRARGYWVEADRRAAIRRAVAGGAAG